MKVWALDTFYILSAEHFDFTYQQEKMKQIAHLRES